MPTKPRTQRKALYQAKLHERHATMGVHLSKELRAKLSTVTRSLPVRKGDRVKIMRGGHKGKTGKVTGVDLRVPAVYVEGIVVRKAKGGEVPFGIHPSKLLLLEADMSDKRRKALLDRKKKAK
ncbi:MAG: 50S ribosomal protein L24 [Candidatus Micrarchaeota archaeon]